MAEIIDNGTEPIENEVVEQTPVVEEVAEKKPSKWAKVGAALKEWGRKQIVTLKRKPQRIPFLLTVIVSCIWLLWLFTFSQCSQLVGLAWYGLPVFANTLLSMLVIFLFIYAFPKRSKPNIVMLVLVFVFMAAMIGMDITIYILLKDFIAANPMSVSKYACYNKSLTYSIVHIVLQVVCIIALATLPLYKKLILKINTAKVVDTNNINESIDIEEE